MNEEPRGNWYLLTGLILGIVAGLALSLYFFPVRFTDSDPSALRDDYRSTYRRLIAEAYRADGNLPRAQARLALLKDDDPTRALAAQAQRVLADGGSPDDARPLAQLAAALNSAPGETIPSTPPPEIAGTGTPSVGGGTPPEQSSGTPAALTAGPGEATATLPPGGATAGPTATLAPGDAVMTATVAVPSATPRPTFTPRPSATPLQVSAAPFTLAHQSQVCDSSLPPAVIAVEVRDKNGAPLAGVSIQVAWDGGQDTFFTGLAPEISPGYADFSMTQGVSYTLRVGEAGAPVSGLTIPACGGAWKLEFQEGAR